MIRAKQRDTDNAILNIISRASELQHEFYEKQEHHPFISSDLHQFFDSQKGKNRALGHYQSSPLSSSNFDSNFEPTRQIPLMTEPSKARNSTVETTTAATEIKDTRTVEGYFNGNKEESFIEINKEINKDVSITAINRVQSDLSSVQIDRSHINYSALLTTDSTDNTHYTSAKAPGLSSLPSDPNFNAQLNLNAFLTSEPFSPSGVDGTFR